MAKVETSKKVIMQSCSWRLFATGLVLMAVCIEASAVLGQMATNPKSGASSPNPRSAISKVQAVTQPAAAAGFSAQEVQFENGTTVTEFLSPNGTVFAIRWAGPVLPDLSYFLGKSFNAFKQETDRVRKAGSHGSPVNMKLDSLVVNSSGRMKSFVGHAYVPSLVPPGVNIKEILE